MSSRLTYHKFSFLSVNLQLLHHSIDVQTLKELGYDSCIANLDNFPGIDDLIIPYFEKDEEVSDVICYTLHFPKHSLPVPKRC